VKTVSLRAVGTEIRMSCLLGAEGSFLHNVTMLNTNVFQKIIFIN